MANMLKMQLKLNVPKALWLFCLFALMVFIPNYPYIVAVGYLALGLFNYLMRLNQNLAMQFCAILPVKRKDIVTSTTFVFVLLQMANVAVLCLALYPAKLINPNGNLVGIDANLAFVGVALICLGAQNLAMLPAYFKTAYKCGMPTLYGLIALLGVYGVCETLVQTIPTLTTALDSYNKNYLWARLVILAIGIVLYLLMTVFANKLAQQKFDKVNL